jgi:CRP-like cAMP-binding protein
MMNSDNNSPENSSENSSTYEVLKKFLAGVISIPPGEWLFLLRHLRIRRLDKGEVFFKQGEHFDDIGFIVRGVMFNYYTNAEGEEFVKVILGDGMLVAPYSTQIQKKPSPFSARTIEKTLLVTLKYSDLEKMYDRNVCWERLGRKMAEVLFARKEDREWQFLMADAKMRYELFKKENAKFLDRIPQYLIASYIGVSPVTLSRIRNE